MVPQWNVNDSDLINDITKIASIPDIIIPLHSSENLAMLKSPPITHG